MDLIDREALPRRELWTWQSGKSVSAVLASDLDAAPTISCERCDYGELVETSRGLVAECGEESRKGAWMSPDDACSRFKEASDAQH